MRLSTNEFAASARTSILPRIRRVYASPWTSLAVVGRLNQFVALVRPRSTSVPHLRTRLCYSAALKGPTARGVEVGCSDEIAKNEMLGAKAKHWLVENLKKAGAGTWKAGVSVATKIITEAALKYYGL